MTEMTTEQVAAYLGVSISEVAVLRKRESLPFRRKGRGGACFYERPAIEALLLRRNGSAPPPAPPAPEPSPAVAAPDWLARMVAEDASLGLRKGTRHTYTQAYRNQIEAEQLRGRLVETDKVNGAMKAGVDAVRFVLAPEALETAHGWDAATVELVRNKMHEALLSAWQREMA